MSTNNHKPSAKEREPVSPEEWNTALEHGDIKEACGRAHLIIIYKDLTIGVSEFRCYRWDCERCLPLRKDIAKELVLSKCSSWPVVSIDDADYVTTTRQLAKSGTRTCTLGTRDLWLFFTEKEVLKGSRVLSANILSQVIDLALSGPHDLSRKSFSYTVGLFPKRSEQLDENILARIIVDASEKRILEILEKYQYTFMKRRDDIDLFAAPGDKIFALSAKELDHVFGLCEKLNVVYAVGPLYERRR